MLKTGTEQEIQGRLRELIRTFQDTCPQNQLREYQGITVRPNGADRQWREVPPM